LIYRALNINYDGYRQKYEFSLGIATEPYNLNKTKNYKGILEDLIVASFKIDFKVSDEYSKRCHTEVMFKNLKALTKNQHTLQIRSDYVLCLDY
jgi:hypothetical protein